MISARVTPYDQGSVRVRILDGDTEIRVEAFELGALVDLPAEQHRGRLTKERRVDAADVASVIASCRALFAAHAVERVDVEPLPPSGVKRDRARLVVEALRSLVAAVPGAEITEAPSPARIATRTADGPALPRARFVPPDPLPEGPAVMGIDPGARKVGFAIGVGACLPLVLVDLDTIDVTEGVPATGQKLPMDRVFAIAEALRDRAVKNGVRKVVIERALNVNARRDSTIGELASRATGLLHSGEIGAVTYALLRAAGIEVDCRSRQKLVNAIAPGARKIKGEGKANVIGEAVRASFVEWPTSNTHERDAGVACAFVVVVQPEREKAPRAVVSRSRPVRADVTGAPGGRRRVAKPLRVPMLARITPLLASGPRTKPDLERGLAKAIEGTTLDKLIAAGALLRLPPDPAGDRRAPRYALPASPTPSPSAPA